MTLAHFVHIAYDLEDVGLLWQPEIGDEISSKVGETEISVLVDTGGLTPRELREAYLWLPTVEQMVLQLEARQAILFHAGLEVSETNFCYKTVIQRQKNKFEGQGASLRNSLGLALRDMLLISKEERFH